MFLNLHTGFSRGRSGGLVFPSLSELSTVIVIHTVQGFGVVNKAEIGVFLELSCFFDDPSDVGNLISVSSAFSKTSLIIWKFVLHVLLKPGLENFGERGVLPPNAHTHTNKSYTRAENRGPGKVGLTFPSLLPASSDKPLD